MANEEYNDNPNEHEEEYHYTDEQPEYDLGETKSSPEKASSGGSVVKNLRERFLKNRRIFLGAIAFLFLLGVVYRMLVPVTPGAVSTDITPVAAVTPTPKKSQQPMVAQSTTPVAAKPQPVRAASNTEISAPSPQEDLIKQLTERVASLEQQNTAVMNLLQTQFVQKMSDADTQRGQLRTQVHDLQSNVVDMQTAFHQLTQLLQGGKATLTPEKNTQGNTSSPTASAADQSTEQTAAATPSYSVQAIIPGRAWLKSDSGDTVTVAEGDTIKGVGKIVRIDPYDGVVSIDTGKKTLTLTYGMSGDQV